MSIGNILAEAVGVFFNILSFAILVRCILSWLPLDRNNFFVKLVYSLTEPILGPVRRLIDKSPLGGGMMIDFSPVIALFILNFVYIIILRVISSIF